MMPAVELSSIASHVGGVLQGDAASVTGLAIDSRQVHSGDLFAALPGDRVDGHDFVQAAVASGAAGVLVRRPLALEVPQVIVDDVTAALGGVAALNRSLFHGPVVAITGSAGKTTAKNMLAAILTQAGPTVATIGNLNNELGVPLTLSRLTAETRFAVVEMGAGAPGDIAYLCGIAAPTVSILLNASAAHLAHYGSVQEIADTKGEILDGLAPDGIAIINADSPYASEWFSRAQGARIVSFGLGEQADCRALDIVYRGYQGSRFVLSCGAASVDVELAVPGLPGVMNALGAAAAALVLGCTPEQVATGLASYPPQPGRGLVLRADSGACVIDDTYNANPASVKAAIDILAQSAGRRVLILGPMLELGSDSERLHEEVGAYSADAGIDELWVVGETAAAIARGFGPQAKCYPDITTAIRSLRRFTAHDTVLVKGSRGAALEAVVAALVGQGVALC
jgi:UDP-N-acetylmuramoyl-tripeptide--D-alanyl-D-alanine ligase